MECRTAPAAASVEPAGYRAAPRRRVGRGLRLRGGGSQPLSVQRVVPGLADEAFRHHRLAVVVVKALAILPQPLYRQGAGSGETRRVAGFMRFQPAIVALDAPTLTLTRA